MKAPRVTPLEGVSTYALRGIRVRGVENPQGFGIDERRFVGFVFRISNLIVFPFMLLYFIKKFKNCQILFMPHPEAICYHRVYSIFRIFFG